MATKGLRTLHISSQPFFQWRGSPIRVGFNVQALAELGHQADLITLPIGERREIPGVRIIRTRNPFGVKNVPIGPSLRKLVFDAILFWHALYLAAKNRYHVIHGNEDAGFLAVVIARLTGAKCIYEKHSDPASYKGGAFRNLVMTCYEQVEAITIRLADAVIATGPGLVEQARRISDTTPVHHIFDVPSSLAEADPSVAQEVRSKLRRQPEEVLATYVGSFATYQGIDLLWKSVPLLVRRNVNVRFLIIGGTTGEIDAATRVLDERGALDAVSFIGKVPPDLLPNYLAASDVLLSPRVAGTNTPLKLIDYLKAGRAIVATNHEANRLILDDSTAVLTAADPASLAEGIERVARDQGLRARLGEQGRARFQERYAFAEFRRRLGECYAGVVKR